MTEEKDYKLLPKIDSPADLRKLNVDQLPLLCDELRHDIIHELSVNPGHLASSLGVVELTVALHYVFDTPYDRIVWDVGHQAYGHKILTGRRDQFCTNRKLGGLKPFPFPTESEYDTFCCGHASNSVSAALGMAVAARLHGEKRKVVAVIGDGAMSGGLAFEGINNAAGIPNDLLVILNDNNMSIDNSVGGMREYLLKLNTNTTYNNLRYRASRKLFDWGVLNEKRRKSIIRFNNSLKSMLTRQQNMFEGMDIRYFGPTDGHDVVELVRVLKAIREMKGPKLLHVHTVKGKGYAPAEENATVWHAPGKFDEESGKRLVSKHENPCPPNRTGSAKRADCGCNSCHANGLQHEYHDARTAKARVRRGYCRRSCSDFLGRYGERRLVAFLQHLFIVHAACLRQYHSRCSHHEIEHGALFGPCRTRGRGWTDTSRCFRPCFPSSNSEPHHCFAVRRAGIAPTDVHCSAERHGHFRDSLSTRTRFTGGLALRTGGGACGQGAQTEGW